MKVRFVDFGKEYLKIRDEILPEIDRVLSAGDLILRKDLEVFEENFAKLVGTKYAIGVASGTDALILSLKALGITGEVIVPSYTFRATVEAIAHAGAIPVLTDLGEDWKQYKTDKTQAIIPAHIAGEILNWQPIDGIIMIEDYAQAIGAGSVMGTTACYSFYPAKILGCYGDGGAIATNDQELYEKLKILRNHNKGDWKEVGYNSRLDNLQAAVLNVKLRHLTHDVERRREIAMKYDKSLNIELKRPEMRKIYQDFIVECASEYERDRMYDFLKNEGVETMKNGYPFPDDFPKLPKASQYESVSLRLPCNPSLEDEEVEYVIEKIKEFY